MENRLTMDIVREEIKRSLFYLSLVLLYFIFKKTSLRFLKNKTNSPHTIAEHALQNLGIPYERLENSAKLSELETVFLLYPRPKNVCISFPEVKDEAFRNQIIQEIKIFSPYMQNPVKQ